MSSCTHAHDQMTLSVQPQTNLVVNEFAEAGQTFGIRRSNNRSEQFRLRLGLIVHLDENACAVAVNTTTPQHPCVPENGTFLISAPAREVISATLATLETTSARIAAAQNANCRACADVLSHLCDAEPETHSPFLTGRGLALCRLTQDMPALLSGTLLHC